MSNIKELRQRKAELVTEGRGLLDKANEEGRSLTEEQGKRFDEIHAEMQTVEASIERHEKQLESERRLGIREDVRTIEGDNGNQFSSLGEQLVAVAQSERDPRRTDPRLYAAPTGAGETFPSEGGFLVQEDFAAELLKRTYELGQILNRTRKIPISSASNSVSINTIDETSRASGSRYGGVQVFRVAEAGTVTAKKPKFSRVRLDLKKIMGLFYATDELLADSTALQAVINQAFPEEFIFHIEDEIINGDGANGMMGILNADALVSVAKETGQLAKTVVYENIINMYSRMWGRSRPNAIWLVNQDVEPQLYQMGITIGTGGSPVFLPPGGISGSPFSTLFGRPVVPVEYCPTLGTVGDILLADFSQYMVAEKGGLQSASSVHVRFINDEMTFRFVLRNDGQPWWKSALTPFKGTSTLSPFVALATRA